MSAPVLPPPCSNCGAIGAIHFTLTYVDETQTELESAGYECWSCGAPYYVPSDNGPYDRMLDLYAALAEEGAEG
jgi:hypothetical protein